jgi:putative alpha-1,2-mannosidase
MYRATPDGYCGDEDNGQTSAWYVFSAMGFYPVCPVSCQYVLGAPLFKKMTINLENGKVIHLNAPNNSAENRYIKNMSYGGKLYTKNWLSHQDLVNGAELDFEMSPVPNKRRGVKPDDVPFSESKPQ